MKREMTHAARAELADAVRARYVAAAGKNKRRILEEFIAATGYHEKSAIRVLNTVQTPKRHQIHQRSSLYDEAVRGVLIVLWEASDRVCGKRLKALLPILLPALERNGHLKLDEQIRPKVLSMSAATIDRLLRMPWIEQKNGAIVRRLSAYRCFEGLAAARAITRLYGASRLFVNFFQPSFKLAGKQRDGAKVTKRYHPPQTPCDSIAMGAKSTLQEISAKLDPLKLLEEIRAVQAYLAALSDGETPLPMTSEPPDLAAFVASLSSAWHVGEIRPTFSIEAKPRYLRGLERISAQAPVPSPTAIPQPATPPVPTPTSADTREKPQIGLRQVRRCPCPSAAHGVADRMQTAGGTSQHQCHAALR